LDGETVMVAPADFTLLLSRFKPGPIAYVLKKEELIKGHTERSNFSL
jgi:hypothetical protein